jgi:hypothetical protein
MVPTLGIIVGIYAIARLLILPLQLTRGGHWGELWAIIVIGISVVLIWLGIQSLWVAGM